MDTMKIGSREFDVLGYISLKGSVTAPLLNIRMMDDRRERELAAQSAAAWEEASKIGPVDKRKIWADKSYPPPIFHQYTS